ncbi:MAG: hypothetical protein ACI82H_002055 [Alphaproteobacteria bacterium]|jgi:hypothetical protein
MDRQPQPFSTLAFAFYLSIATLTAGQVQAQQAQQGQTAAPPKLESGPLLEGAALESRVRALVDGILVRDKLDPLFWKDGTNGKLDPDVRKSLLSMAKVFIKGMKLKDAPVIDIIFAGSLTGYLYHSRSDLDIHVNVDARALGIKPKYLQGFLFNKSKSWSEGRHFSVRGREVQILMLDPSVTGEHSKGVYSLLKDRWLRKPERPTKPIDRARIYTRTLNLVGRFQEAVRAYKKDPHGTDCNVLRAFTKTLKKERRIGFQTVGEYAEANLVYKALRNGRYTRAGETLSTRCLEARLNLP